MLRKTFLNAFATALFAVFALASCNPNSQNNTSSSSKSGSTLTVKGEVLDMSCFMIDGSKGQSHQSCAQGCLDKGLPAGLLSDSDGQVYLLVENHDKADAYTEMLKHAAENVEITGTVIVKNGVQSLSVEDIKIEG